MEFEYMLTPIKTYADQGSGIPYMQNGFKGELGEFQIYFRKIPLH